jgi:hypothetical protein
MREIMMSSPFPPLNELTLEEMVTQVHDLLGGQADRPTTREIEEVCNVLYASSLLKEEGRVVRARVVIAPPDAFFTHDGPLTGINVVRFERPHPLTSHAIKGLSPAASFFHSAIGIWPDRDRGFRIWGIINTGPRWLNLVAGGRKSAGEVMPHPIIHVRDPGWLLFYYGYSLLAEWRGREFHGPRMDVFQSRLLHERFADHRLEFVQGLIECCLPGTLSVAVYADLSHLISLQFVKRIINLVRSSGHGGSLVFIPESKEGSSWIDCKYPLISDGKVSRFRTLLHEMIRRVGELCEPGATADEAWQVFRNRDDAQLDRLEESFFELARLLSDLMQVDGALVLDQSLRIIGFGGEIRVDRNVLAVGHARDLDGRNVVSWNVQSDGTRHRSVYRLCSVEPSVLGFVISQDSHVRMIANVADSVIFWQHSMI